MTSTQEHIFDPARPTKEDMHPGNSSFRLPSEATIMAVTPEMASDWYSYRNHPRNRITSKTVSARYQALMEAGRWQERSPEGLIFDTEGYIISAAHRMRALANVDPGVLVEKYGHPYLEFRVFPNESREDLYPVVDAGYKRTASHLLRIPYSTSIAAAARHIAALQDGDDWGTPRYGKISSVEVVDTFKVWPEVAWYMKDLWAVQHEHSIPASAHAAVLAQAVRTEYGDRVPEWVKGIVTGAGLGETDPRLHLQRRFRRGITTEGVKRDMQYSLIVKAWNDFATDKPMTMLRHSVVEQMPRVVGFDFEKRVA